MMSDIKCMKPTLLANSWMAAHLPREKYMAVLCCAGSDGESAFRNSLDGAFARAGYEHLPASLNRRRPPTYYVIGALHRIAHASTLLCINNEFYDALILSNATTWDLSLDAVRVDMTQMTSLKELPDSFFRGSTGLRSIMLPPNVEEFGSNVLGGCKQLASLDMSSLTRVKKLPDYFMRGSVSLTSIVLPPKVEELGIYVLSGCTQLTSLDLDMSSLTDLKKLNQPRL